MASTAQSESPASRARAIKSLCARYVYQTQRLQEATEAGEERGMNQAMIALEKMQTEAAEMDFDQSNLDAAVLAAQKPGGALADTGTSAGASKQTKAQKGADEVAKRAQAVAAERASKPKTAREPRPKKEVKLRPCLDGCGVEVPGNFKMGHDAKLKSLIIKIERGEEAPDSVPDVAQDLVKFKKSDLEEIKNAKGVTMEKRQTWLCTAAPVRFPGRSDIALTVRED